MDRFERGWFNLSRAAQRWTSRRAESKCSGELHCDICDDSETTSHNLIVLCESCDIAVHQDCYGVPLIPEGPWLCRKCYLNAGDVSCCLCPWKAGAFKQTTDASKPWCHLFCSYMLGGETHVLNTAYQEPVDIGKIHPERWGLICQICRQKSGAPIQCSVKSCHMALHPKCARYARCTMNIASRTLMCFKHSMAMGPEGFSPASDCGPVCPVKNEVLNKPSGHGRQERTFQKPFICQAVADCLLQTTICASMSVQHKMGAIESISRYWSLKRAARHGAALIKTLQVEPWTSGDILSNVQESLGRRKDLLLDLCKLEGLCSLIYKREKLKLSTLLMDMDLVHIALDPINVVLSVLISELRYL